MTIHDEYYSSINISPEEIEIIRDYYLEPIEEALVTNSEGFVAYVLPEHIRLLKCHDELAFREIVLIPVINQILKSNSISNEKVNTFLKNQIRFPGVF
ncbi:MAG: hypothetical protein WKF36_10810 [Candidatus Nitrosocosmicus sp.]